MTFRGYLPWARTLTSVATLTALVSVFGGGCLVVEPPGDLPSTPVRRPTIRRSEASPPASQILGAWPDSFVVPVELVDASQSFQWRVFIDYDSEAVRPKPAADGTSAPNLSDRNGNVRTVRAIVAPPADLTGCHVVEFLVATRFLGDLEARPSHTPAPPGGDALVWFYSPGGDLSGCPVYNATIDAAVPDAGGDASRDGAL